MNALDRAIAERHAGQFLPEFLGQKRCEWGDELRRCQQALVQRPIRIKLNGIVFVGAPESFAAAADVPIRERINERRDRAARGKVVVRIHPFDDDRRRTMEFAHDPTIEFATLVDRTILSGLREQLRSSCPTSPPSILPGSNPSMLA